MDRHFKKKGMTILTVPRWRAWIQKARAVCKPESKDGTFSKIECDIVLSAVGYYYQCGRLWTGRARRKGGEGHCGYRRLL